MNNFERQHNKNHWFFFKCVRKHNKTRRVSTCLSEHTIKPLFVQHFCDLVCEFFCEIVCGFLCEFVCELFCEFLCSPPSPPSPSPPHNLLSRLVTHPRTLVGSCALNTARVDVGVGKVLSHKPMHLGFSSEGFSKYIERPRETDL